MATTMRAVRFPEHGEPDEVPRRENVPVPEPGTGRIRVAVHACGLALAAMAVDTAFRI